MISLFCILASSILTPKYLRKELHGIEPLTFKQKTDHNDNSNTNYFDQRYFEVWNQDPKDDAPVILKVGGESDALTPGGNGTDFITVLAKDINAAVVLTLEHRYFGKSFPTTTTTVADYALLTVEQALADLKYFQEEYVKAHPNLKSSKWLIVGGSYPGALSAIARAIYPDNFHAAISSSGVVYASDDFKDFDLQDAVSMGQECAAAARAARIKIDQMIDDPSTNEYIKNLFGAAGLTDQNFRFVIGEIFTLALQYNHVEKVCGPLVDSLRSGDDAIMALAKFTKDYFIPTFCDGDLARTYSDDEMKKMASTTENVAPRSWLWMTCNELAYWQTSPGRLGLRSPKLDKESYQEQCRNVFGDGIKPNPEAFNQKYGGLTQTIDRVYYTTGSQDPWTWACVTEDSGVQSGSYAHTITGPNMGHCSDLHAPSPNDPIDLVRTRKHMREVIKGWMN